MLPLPQTMFKWKREKEHSESSRVVVDLDRILVEAVSFQFDGRVYEIKPLTTAEFLKVSQRLAVMDSLRVKKQITDQELIDAYAAFFNSMCHAITKKTVAKMTPQQAAALFQLMVDCVTGKAYSDPDTEKKKPVTTSLH